MVEAPILCSDLGEKEAADLLHKDDQLSIATHAAGGVAITSSEIKKGDLLLADVSTNLKNKNVTIDMKVDTDPNVITSSEIKKGDLLLADASTQLKNKNVITDSKVDINMNAITSSGVKIGDLPLSDVSTQLKNKNITTDVKTGIILNDDDYKMIRNFAFYFIGIHLYFITQMMILVKAKNMSGQCSQKAVHLLVSLSLMSFGFLGVPSVLHLLLALSVKKTWLRIGLPASLCYCTYQVIRAIFFLLGC